MKLGDTDDSARSARALVPPVRSRSWWLDEALRADPGVPCPPLAADTVADVCVVGGGFAGLWTAYELSERTPDLGVVLLESDICGAGGSGANGGFFSPSWTQLSSLCASLGEAGREPGLLPRSVIAAYGSYGARNGAVRDD